MPHIFKKVLVTGGAGFIGSHLVDKLMNQNYEVTVLDNLSTGKLKNLRQWLNDTKFTFIKGDLKKPKNTEKATRNTDLVFHFAANPEVRTGKTKPSLHFQENLSATFNLLESIREERTIPTLVFASTSTVYGDATVLPTPEDYGPAIPISTYGASKLGAEALMSAYAHTFNARTLILRFANIVGPRATIGVVLDFVRKMQQNPRKLEILGDGTQTKSYLYVDDCVEAIFCALDRFLKSKSKVSIYNVGSQDQIAVKRIAQITVEEMGVAEPEFILTGGEDGGRGWRGDVKHMHLSIEKLLKTGWRPRYNSEEAIRKTIRALLNDPQC